MEQRLKDARWRGRNGLCAFLSLIPGLGFFGLLFMGKKAGRKQYRTLGSIYGALSILIQVLMLAAAVFMEVKYLFYQLEHTEFYYFLQNFIPNFQEYLWLAFFVLWLACILHTLCLRGQYLQYLALQEVRAPQRNPIVYNKKWRQENLWWMFLSWLPVFNGFGPWFAGYRMKRTGLKVLGILTMLSAATVHLANLWIDAYSASWSFDVSWALVVGGIMLFTALNGVNILVSFLIREDYLDARAVQWTSDIHECHVLANPKWRRSNSLWHIWTALPYVGGIGIAIAGIRSKRRKNVFLGVAICLLTAAVLFGHTAMVNIYNATYENYWANRHWYATIGVIPQLTFFLYLFSIFAGMEIHWESLKGRAASLQGYATEFEREADLYQRMAARSAAPAAMPQPAPAPAPVPVPAPAPAPAPRPAPVPRPVEIPSAPAAPTGTVDINHCTQSDYMTLPGFTVAMAHRAMEYRSQNGGFRSADEFVEVLQIKPHFAVQIFDRVILGEQPVSHAQPRPDGVAARRRIDF